MGGWLRQVLSVTSMGLRGLPRRAGTSISAAVGVAGVVGVLVAVLSIAEGFQRTLALTGDPDSAIVMRGGATSESDSNMTLDEVRIIADAPGIRRVDGRAQSSAELFVIYDVPMRESGSDANVPLRGVEQTAFSLRDDVEIIAGERFRPGRNEVIVGRAAHRQFRGLDVGSELRWGENTWKVVGLFTAGGSGFESEIWCDIRVLQPAARRENAFQSVHVRLESAAAFGEFKDALTTDPRLDVKVQRQSDYFADQSQTLSGIINSLGYGIATLMSIGAVFGAIVTLYSAIAARAREIATLRALGFSSGAVVTSVLVESTLIALVGGSAGALAAYLMFNGYQASTLNFDTFSQLAFSFAVTPRLMLQGLTLALALGLLGGILPAYRAARLPVAIALRQH